MHRASFLSWGTSIFLSSIASVALAQPEAPPTADPPPPDAGEPAAPTDPAEVAAEGTEEAADSDASAEEPEQPAGDSSEADAESGADAEAGAKAGGSLSAGGLFPNPEADAATLEAQGRTRPGKDGKPKSSAEPPGKFAGADSVFAEDWWTHARPIIEFHGYLRTRAELFHNFSLDRVDPPNNALWAQPSDHRFTPLNGSEIGPELCTSDETDVTVGGTLRGCDNNTQAGANIRLRLNPEIHVSDNLRVLAQIDLLDNLVLGSTPNGYNFGAGADGLEVSQRSGYNRLGFYDNNQLAPSASSNSLTDSVVVKRAWGEYTTPLGELRFGRMPDHWGLGMLYNAGDGHDDDYQSTIDRLMFTTGFRALDLVIGATWDFPNEGALGSVQLPGAQPYDRSSLDDVDQWSLVLMRRKAPELQKLALARGDLVLNAGLYFKYRTQTLANDQSGAGAQAGVVPGQDLEALAQGFSRREAEAFVPDVWFQLLYKKFRFEAEGAAILGTIASADTAGDNAAEFENNLNQTLNLAQWGFATELEQKFIEDRLRLRFNAGLASGDPDAFDDSIPGDLVPGPNEVQVNDDTDSTFRFHPGYRVDLILNRNILNRIQGTYYISPSVEYDFIRDPDGQRAGGGVKAVWTRATQFVQTPGHARDLGIELNGTLYFQAKDGGLNDTPDSMGGFYSALQYGVLFPLSGMGYLEEERVNIVGDGDTSAAQILRLYLGVIF